MKTQNGMEKQIIPNRIVYKNKVLIYILSIIMTAITTPLFASENNQKESQNNTQISGIVKDNSGEPLIGVSVQVKGKAIGTVTDIDGKFQLNIPQRNDILIFSYLGYTTQEVKVPDNNFLNIVLQNNVTELEEAVVVGYGIQKKESVVAAISSVDIPTLKVAAPRSINNILAGKVAGIISVQRSGEPGKDDAQSWNTWYQYIWRRK